VETISLGIVILIVLSVIVSTGGVMAVLIAYMAGRITNHRLSSRHRA